LRDNAFVSAAAPRLRVRVLARARFASLVRAAALLTLAAAAGLTALVPPGEARAADPADSAAVGKITLLNRKAIEQYQNLDFDQSQRLLQEALDLAEHSGLNQHPIRARTYVTMGIVALGGLKQRDLAIRYFRKALQIQPEIKLSRGLANPEIEAAFDEAIAGLGSEPNDEAAPGAPGLPEKPLAHDPVRQAIQGQAVAIAASPDQTVEVDALVLFYRPAGATIFSEVRMQRRPSGVFEGLIPAQMTTAGQVAYYIEARAADGKVVSSRGSAATPLVVTLSPAPAAVEPPRARETAPAGNDRRFFFALSAGTGVGWMSGSGEETGMAVPKGTLAWARLGHLAPQVGYLFTPRLMLGLQARLQRISGATEYHLAGQPPDECGGDGVCSPATGALAGLLKGTWFFGAPRSAFRPYASVSIGGGTIRHVTTFSGTKRCGAQGTAACVDTLAGGSFLAGPGVGFVYQLSDAVGLVFAIEGLVGTPKFTANLDGNLGVAFQL
jgi:tetratricopeptide (TPR) repeat protein